MALSCLLFRGMAQDVDTCSQGDRPHVMATSQRVCPPVSKPRPKKVALVLSGGGAKGMAHIGVLKVLERAGIPVDIITGTSMGSIVGGIYACGHRADELDSIVRLQNWSFVLSDRMEPRRQSLHERERQNTYFISKELGMGKKARAESGGFIAGRNISTLLETYTQPYADSIDFNTLPIHFACVATNIVDYTEYVFHSGVLSKAMRASMSIPGVFSPVRMGDMVLIDGGLRNNFPADIAREMGADYVIGVDVQGEEKTADQLGSASSILMQVLGFNCKNKFKENMELTDVYIRVNTNGYSAASFSNIAIDTLIHRGEVEAMRHWDDLVKLRKELGYGDDNVNVNENVNVNGQWSMVNGQRSMANDPTSSAGFDQQTKERPMINVGMRFDNEEMVSLQANAVLPLKSKTPMDIELTMRLGKRIMGRIDWAMRPLSFFRPTVSYVFRNNDLDYYEYGKKAYSMTYNQHAVKVKLFNFNVRNLNVSIGAEWNYYDYHSVLSDRLPTHMDDEEINDKGFVSYKLTADYNSENHWYFPTRGVRFHGKYAYHTDNFVRLNGAVGMREYLLMGRASFPFNRHFSLQTMLYCRMLYGHEVPFVMSNMMGGEWFGHYVEQQIPFAGVGYMELSWDKIFAAQLQAQYNMTPNSVLLLRVAAGQDADTVKELPEHKVMIGSSLSYYYNTMFGPLGASVGYSNLTKKFYYYINLGYVF